MGGDIQIQGITFIERPDGVREGTICVPELQKFLDSFRTQRRFIDFEQRPVKSVKGITHLPFRIHSSTRYNPLNDAKDTDTIR